MKRSKFFIQTNKSTPNDATLKSHKLMIQSGMILQQSSGLYVFGGLATLVLNKISNVIREVFTEHGFQEIIMPIMQPRSVWEKSGRSEIYGDETLIAKDRKGCDLIFSPTNEEIVTDYFSQVLKTYKQLPVSFYQINWKFRDEIRPRHGLMRAREFLMMDLYSFDKTKEDEKNTFVKVFNAYVEIFNRLGLKVLPTRADNGVIGGDFSYEFNLLTPHGDTNIYYKTEELNKVNSIEDIENIDCAVEEKKNQLKEDIKNYKTTKGIELGHLFLFDEKYTKSMDVKIQDENGTVFHPFMGSYGIGVSRMIAAVIESSHDEKGIIFPKTVSPFDVYLVDTLNNNESEKIYKDLSQQYKVLHDDRDVSFGEKIHDAELLGFPLIAIVGKKYLETGEVEWKKRS